MDIKTAEASTPIDSNPAQIRVGEAGAIVTGNGEKPSLRIALFMEALPNTGGGFQQSLSLIEALAGRHSDRHTFVVFATSEAARQRLCDYGINAILYRHRPFNWLDRWSATNFGYGILRRLRRLGFKRLGRHVDAMLDDYAIDLAILNDLGDVAWCIGDHPFMIAVWDLDHRDYPDMPEAFADRLFERRERKLRMTILRATGVIINSSFAARRIRELYQVADHRLIEMPLLPSVTIRRMGQGSTHKTDGSASETDVRRKYKLPDSYVFYPASLLVSKNHLYLLEGLAALKKNFGLTVDAVLCGTSDSRSEERLRRQTAALGMENQVHFLGFVPDADIAGLYQNAVAMVMPTYTGPENIPPLEAVAVGCPVIYSDLPGCRALMGDAALYCDLSDPGSLAAHLASLIGDSMLRERLQKAGRQLATEMDHVDYNTRLLDALDRYAYLRRRWAWP
jgi:glycosyltransferase involved in cell wall biosynthesis